MPRKKEGFEDTVSISVRVPEGLMDKVEMWAKKRNYAVLSQFVIDALRAYLDELELRERKDIIRYPQDDSQEDP